MVTVSPLSCPIRSIRDIRVLKHHPFSEGNSTAEGVGDSRPAGTGVGTRMRNSHAMTAVTSPTAAHRIGQKKKVYVVKLIASGSIEEKVLELQRRKQAVIAATVSTTDAAIVEKLSTNDLAELLS